MRSFEDLIQDLGGTGRSQVLIIVLVTLFRVMIGWCTTLMTFVKFVPKWCCLPDNATTSDSDCQEDGVTSDSRFSKKCWLNASSCDRRVFQSGVRTMVNEWDLVCEKKWMVPLTPSILMFGYLLGAMIAGQLSDLIGRKKTVFLSAGCLGIFSIIASFSVNWEMFAVCCFLNGVCIGGYNTSSIPYTTEFVVPSRRAAVTILPSFHIGGCLLALTAWRIQDWRTVSWISGVITLPLLLSYFFLPESLRWLSVQGRVDEAQKVVEWIARWNKSQVPKDSLEVIQAVATEAKSASRRTKYTYLDIYKGWRLFKISVILQFLWCIMAMCQYGFTFGASSFGSNMYLNILLFSCVGMPNFVMVSLTINRLGRKKTTIVFLLLASASGFGSLAVKLTLPTWDKQVIVIIVLNLFSRAAVGCAWSAIMIATNESYPTVIRGVGYGASNVVSRTGAIVAPFALNFEDNPVLSPVVVGVTLLVGAVAVMFLEETAGKAMQDAIIVAPEADTKNTGQGYLQGNMTSNNGVTVSDDVSKIFTQNNASGVWYTTPEDNRSSSNRIPVYQVQFTGSGSPVEHTRL